MAGGISAFLPQAGLASLISGWEIGQQAPDFAALYIDSTTSDQVATNWYAEAGADAYVVSLCGMWCGTCQVFGQQSEAITQQLLSEGIDVQMYDLIFQDVAGQEPDADDARNWINALWTADPENVWFGGNRGVGLFTAAVPGVIMPCAIVAGCLLIRRCQRTGNRFCGRKNKTAVGK